MPAGYGKAREAQSSEKERRRKRWTLWLMNTFKESEVVMHCNREKQNISSLDMVYPKRIVRWVGHYDGRPGWAGTLSYINATSQCSPVIRLPKLPLFLLLLKSWAFSVKTSPDFLSDSFLIPPPGVTLYERDKGGLPRIWMSAPCPILSHPLYHQQKLPPLITSLTDKLHSFP